MNELATAKLLAIVSVLACSQLKSGVTQDGSAAAVAPDAAQGGGGGAGHSGLGGAGTGIGGAGQAGAGNAGSGGAGAAGAAAGSGGAGSGAGAGGATCSPGWRYDNLPACKALVQNNPLAIPIAPTCTGEVELCCPGGVSPPSPDPRCFWDGSVTDLTLTVGTPGTLGFMLRATVRLSSASGATVPVHIMSSTFASADCRISVDSTVSGVRDVLFSGTLTYGPTDGGTRAVGISGLSVTDLEAGDVSFSGSGQVCSVAGSLTGLFVSTFASQLGTLVPSLFENATCLCPG